MNWVSLSQLLFDSPGAAVLQGIFLLVKFQRRLSSGVHTPPCAIACINICAHVKDPIVHFRVWWIMETLKHPACTVGLVAQLCCSCLPPREGNPNFPWEKSLRDNTIIKSFKKFKEVKKMECMDDKLVVLDAGACVLSTSVFVGMSGI